MRPLPQRFRLRPQVSPRRMAGSAMLEALIALTLFGAGIVGLVGLQAKMVTAQSEGKFRGDAVYLVSELVGTMWADVPNLNNYVTATCAGYARCKEWTDKVAATLPGGAATVTVNTGVVTVTVTWSPPNAGTHNYSASTAIRI